MTRLITSINDTIQRGGSFLIPVFALGRMQELLSVLHDARKFGRLVDCPIYASGLGMDLATTLTRSARKTKHVQFNRIHPEGPEAEAAPRKLKPGDDPHRTGSTSSAPA
jgi:predicted metal-dependent RNase